MFKRIASANIDTTILTLDYFRRAAADADALSETVFDPVLGRFLGEEDAHFKEDSESRHDSLLLDLDTYIERSHPLNSADMARHDLLYLNPAPDDKISGKVGTLKTSDFNTITLPEQIQKIEGLIGDHPDDFELYLARARFLKANDEGNRALIDLVRFFMFDLKGYPHLAVQGHFLRGELMRDLGQEDLAKASFQDCKKLSDRTLQAFSKGTANSADSERVKNTLSTYSQNASDALSAT